MNYSTVAGALCASVLAFMSTATNAAFIELGNGLIYDEAQKLTWTRDAGLSGALGWQQAIDWAASQTFGGVGGWRLPTTTQFGDPTCGADVRGVLFFEHRVGCGGGEMEQLSATAGTYDWFTNTLGGENGELFVKLDRSRYWTATPYRDWVDPCIDPGYGVECNLANDNGDRTNFYWQWGFGNFGEINGPAYKTTLRQGNPRYAWAVHDGLVSAVPVPAAVWLFGSGLLALFGITKRRAA